MDLISQCAIRVAKLVWRPGHGGYAFTVVCKATFELRPGQSPLAPAQDPVVERDVYGGPEQVSLAQASELIPFKKRPEVLLAGHAYAPGGQPVPSLAARLVAGEIDKSIQVEGDRYFDSDGWITDPEPFVRMPLVWERAAGGPGTVNPAGRALDTGARPDAYGRVQAPNLLPPGLFLTSRRKVVPPVGFGPIAPPWPPRASHLKRHSAGWDPDRWNERPLPADVDVAYFNAAPSDQQRAAPFGEEQIYLENLHPRFAQLATRLVPVTPGVTVDRGSGPEPLRLRCDTLMIDTDRGLAMLVWRGHVLLDRGDAPGRVIVTGPGAPEATPHDDDVTIEPNLAFPGRAATIDPIRGSVAAPALPFSRKMTLDPIQAMLASRVTPFPEGAVVPAPSEPRALLPASALPFAKGAPLPEPEPGATSGGLPRALLPTVVLPFAEGAAPPDDIADQETEDEDSSPDPFADFAATGPRTVLLLGDQAPAGIAAPAQGEREPLRTVVFTEDATQVGAPARAATLPFATAQGESAPRPRSPLLVLGSSSSAILAPGGPSPFPSPGVPSPILSPERVVAAAEPAPTFVLESASSTPAAGAGADPDLTRLRLIQRAIWKGDRPARQILAEHGLTEIEWRAMKRASATKISA